MDLISFNTQQIKEILELIGEDTSEPFIKVCETCHQDLDLASIGFIARGADDENLIFCGKVSCFVHIIAKNYPKSELSEGCGKWLPNNNGRCGTDGFHKECSKLEQDAPSDNDEIKKEIDKDYE